jgi:hypothetical protein
MMRWRRREFIAGRRLVTGLTVQADTLLDPPFTNDGGDARVKLVISVELKPDYVTMFNLGFA